MHEDDVCPYNEKAPRNIDLEREPTDRTWRSSLGTISGATLLAFLTRLLCPACWPAYAGVMSSLGLGFLLQKIWLIPLTIITLLFVLGSLAWRAKSRRGYAPLLLGLLGSAALLGGQFVFPSLTGESVLSGWVMISKWSVDAGAVVLVAASLWNGCPRKRTDKCPSCSLEATGG